MVKVDLHTHSYGSPDGGISLLQYKKILDTKTLDYVAVTDHNAIESAQRIQKELGDRVIVGEEIMTTAGEIIGLYLTKLIPSGLSPVDAVAQIKAQGGIVYVPHPFETVRSGLDSASLKTIIKDVDIIELRNGRALLQNMTKQAREWASMHEIAVAASSDAHSARGIGRTYSLLSISPTKKTLVAQLKLAEHSTKLASLPSLLSPKANRIKRRLKRS